MQTEPSTVADHEGRAGRRPGPLTLVALGLALAAFCAWLVFARPGPALEVPPLLAEPAAGAEPGHAHGHGHGHGQGHGHGHAESAAAAQAAGSGRAISLTLAGGRLQGGSDTIKLRQGEDVRLSFASDQPIVLHLHGYELHAEAGPEQQAVLAFKAHMPGRFPVHEHREGPGNHRAVVFVEVHP